MIVQFPVSFFFSKGGSLKVVSTFSVGTDHLNVAELKESGVRIGYTPGVLTEAVAEFAVALLLATSRRFNESYKIIHKYYFILHLSITIFD